MFQNNSPSDSLPAIATPGRGEPMAAPLPIEIVRRHLSNYARPVVQIQTTRVNAPLQRCTKCQFYHQRTHIDTWTSSARCANSTNSTMSPLRRPRCASSPSHLRKGQGSGFSPWAVSLIHGETWKTHFCVSTNR